MPQDCIRVRQLRTVRSSKTRLRVIGQTPLFASVAAAVASSLAFT
jgi:hypothetical protein